MRNTTYVLISAYLLSFLFVVFPTHGEAACTPITRTLRVGMVGEDVRMLQKFLNDDPVSKISATGTGSPGKESTVFGPATLRAVMKFQEQNKEEILIPAGVDAPTGIIGKMMRGVINDYFCATGSAEVVATSTPTGTETFDTAANQKKLAEIKSRADVLFAKNEQKLDDALVAAKQRFALLDDKINKASTAIAKVKKMEDVYNTLSDPNTKIVPGIKGGVFGGKDPLQVSVVVPSVALKGDRIGIIGSGFLENNTVHVGDKSLVAEMPNSDGTVLYVRLPADIPSGKSVVYVENTKGKSEPVPFIIADKMTAAPTISGFSPAKAGLGKTLTITGTNFLQTNDIYTSLGMISGVSSSDGKTLTFTVSAQPVLIGPDGKLLEKVPFTVLVGNDNGLSSVLEIPFE